MKVFIVLAAVMACASAQILVGGIPSTINYGYSALAPAVTHTVVSPAVTKSQYHAQDELGQASYGHSEPGQAHAAIRDAAGNVRGAYAYIDPNGKEVRVNYVAGHGGFRVESNALPQAPVAILAGPAPVQDTPEVVAARIAHFNAVAEAQARSGRKKRQIAIVQQGLGLGYSGLGVSHLGLAHPGLGYSNLGAPVHVAAHPGLAYSVAAPAVVAAAQPVREATLTRIVNTPGHAVSYRVD